MAAHVQSVAGSSIRRVTKAEFYKELRPGDLLFCSGRELISKAIEGLTSSPWSHVLMCWLPGSWASEWLTLEATFQRGVHVGRLADYVERYNGDLLIARRPSVSSLDIYRELNCGLSLVGEGYDWAQEFSIACRKLCPSLPLIEPAKELYCSGLQYVMSLAGSRPLQRPAASYPTPEDNWTDPTVEAVCVLARC